MATDPTKQPKIEMCTTAYRNDGITVPSYEGNSTSHADQLLRSVKFERFNAAMARFHSG